MNEDFDIDWSDNSWDSAQACSIINGADCVACEG
jgi:hypothetical protein